MQTINFCKNDYQNIFLSECTHVVHVCRGSVNTQTDDRVTISSKPVVNRRQSTARLETK